MQDEQVDERAIGASEAVGHPACHGEPQRPPQSDCRVVGDDGVELHRAVVQRAGPLEDVISQGSTDSPAGQRWVDHERGVRDVAAQPGLVRFEHGRASNPATVYGHPHFGWCGQHPYGPRGRFIGARCPRVGAPSVDDLSPDRPDVSPVIHGRKPELDATIRISRHTPIMPPTSGTRVERPGSPRVGHSIWRSILHEGGRLAAMWGTLLVFPGLPRMGIRLRVGGRPTGMPLGPAAPLEFRQPMPEQAELVAFWVGKDMPRFLARLADVGWACAQR